MKALKLTLEEYEKLKYYLAIVKDKNNSRGIRRLAMASFDFIFKNRTKNTI
jgi:hypothetical protein